MRNGQNGNGRQSLVDALKATGLVEDWQLEDVPALLEQVATMRSGVKTVLPEVRKLLKENAPLIGELVAVLWETLNEASKPCDKLYDGHMTSRARNVGYYLKALTKAGLTRKEAMQVIVAKKMRPSTNLPNIDLSRAKSAKTNNASSSVNPVERDFMPKLVYEI